MKPTPEQIAKLPKWAQAHITELELRVVHLEGIPGSQPAVARDLPHPSIYSALARGWDFNIHSLKCVTGGACVVKQCSSGGNHGYGWDRTSSQRPKNLFTTERRAWLAAKSDFIKYAAETVRFCDKQIAAASDEPYSETSP